MFGNNYYSFQTVSNTMYVVVFWVLTMSSLVSNIKVSDHPDDRGSRFT